MVDSAIWMLNSLMQFKATAATTDGAYELIEQRLDPAGNPPPHIHRDQDEAFFVLDGEVHATVGARTTALQPGQFLFAPRGVPHGYQVHDEARLLIIVSPASLEAFFREVGEPATAQELPTPQPPDVARVVAAAARFGIDLLPPPAGIPDA